MVWYEFGVFCFFQLFLFHVVLKTKLFYKVNVQLGIFKFHLTRCTSTKGVRKSKFKMFWINSIFNFSFLHFCKFKFLFLFNICWNPHFNYLNLRYCVLMCYTRLFVNKKFIKTSAELLQTVIHW